MNGLPPEVLAKLSPEQLELLQIRLQGMARKEGAPQRAPIRRLPREAAAFELSFLQNRYCFLQQLDPGTPYNVATGVRLRGDLDVRAFTRALAEVVRRHEALRTRFVFGDRPMQVIDPAPRLEIPMVDLEGLPAGPRQAAADQIGAAEARQLFDLSRGPLLRTTLLRCAPDHHQFLLVVHHIAVDAWSIAVLLGDLVDVYTALRAGEEPALEPPAVQYVDFAAWQREQIAGARLEELLAFWKRTLAGAPPLLELPADHLRPAIQDLSGAAHPFALTPGLAAAVRDVSQRGSVTHYVTLLAAYAVLLQRLSGRDDLVIGSASANRGRPELRRLVGPVINGLVLRVDLSGDPTFLELLARVHQMVLEAHAHQDLPFEKIVESVRPERDPAYSPIFQTAFLLQGFPVPRRLPGVDLEILSLDRGDARFDLSLVVSEEPEGLAGELQYATSLFEPETAGEIVESYLGVLTALAGAPETRISQASLTPALARRAAEAIRRRQRRPLTVTSTFTAEPLADVLAFWSEELELGLEVRFSPYNQVFQQLLDPGSLLASDAARDGIGVVLVRCEDWLRFADGQSGAGPAETLEHNVSDLAAALASWSDRDAGPLLVAVCPPSGAALSEPGIGDVLERAEERLAAGLAGRPGIHLMGPRELFARYPVEVAEDREADALGHVPYTPELFAALGTLLVRRMYALLARPRKVVAIDCDQTLWRGVCGEDGPLGIEVDPPRRRLQELLVRQHEAGMLLCLCSKNSEQDVLEVFEKRPEMPLGLRHLVAWKVNWRSKSENLRDLARELDLGLDSFVLLDDNPVECGEVEASLPEVLVLRLPEDPAEIPRLLEHAWVFDRLTVTAEDSRRTELYRENALRERFRGASVDFASFLAGLELRVDISPLAPGDVERAAQLTQRTNQFNVRALRSSEAEILDLRRSGTECHVVRVRDRFGDYGLVGVVLFATRGSSLAVHDFLLSCRVLGRGAEHRILAWLGEVAGERGCAFVEIPYRPTDRNQPALDFLAGVRGGLREEAAEGQLFRFPTEVAAGARLDPRSPTAGPAAERPRERAATEKAQSGVFRRIALEL
ncbi:MAG TPA: HAD-IIIC family phosphatase, partial [Thermoanaerobaculia bacterium]|nr:HAD-IIIC family phosphatase [Thermoanaerobaculia bacterium]